MINTQGAVRVTQIDSDDSGYFKETEKRKYSTPEKLKMLKVRRTLEDIQMAKEVDCTVEDLQ